VTRRSCIRFLFLMVTAAALFSVACHHKPAYSDVQPSESEKSREQRARQQPSADAAAEPAPPSGSADQQAKPEQPAPSLPVEGESTATPRSTEIKPPQFLDQNTGEFKDLPRYPRATRTYAQVGPINGIEAGMFMLETAASYERIAEFYDQAIKKNGWTIVSNTRDPEYFKWELRKGKSSEALIEVKSDGKSTRKSILLSRAERPPGK
jgi:hypothetical protein